MKITPLEIRQKDFQKGFRGYDKDEVEAFLLSLSQEWERMVEDNKEHKIKFEQAQKEVAKLREVEDSLFKTLKTAETTGANVVDHANKSAELIIQESRMKAEQTIDDAQRKSDKIFTQMLNEFSELEREFRTIESSRDNLVSEIKNLASDSLERVSKIDTDRKNLDHIKNMVSKMAVEKDEVVETKVEAPVSEKPVTIENTPKVQIENTPKTPIENTSKESSDDDKSFFDEIGG